MAVIRINEIWQARTGDYNEGAILGGLERNYKRHFRVFTDNPLDGPGVIFASFDGVTIIDGKVYPALFTAYENTDGSDSDQGALCRKLECEHDQDQTTQWLVTATYSTETRQPEFPDLSPTERPPKRSWRFEKYQKAVEKHYGGPLGELIAIVNSAKDPYDPPPTIDDSRLTYTVTRNVVDFDFDKAAQYQDAVNSDEFKGFPAGEWKVAQYDGEEDFEQGVTFWRETIKVEHRREGWILSLLDAGYRSFNVFTGRWQPLADGQGRPPQKPIPLNGAGQVLPFAQDPIFNSYIVYKAEPFADLNLP